MLKINIYILCDTLLKILFNYIIFYFLFFKWDYHSLNCLHEPIKDHDLHYEKDCFMQFFESGYDNATQFSAIIIGEQM